MTRSLIVGAVCLCALAGCRGTEEVPEPSIQTGCLTGSEGQFVLTDLDPVRMRFTLAGQANAILLNPHFEVVAHRVLVMNPDVPTWDWLFHGRQRRVCQAAEVHADGKLPPSATRKRTERLMWRTRSAAKILWSPMPS